MPIIDKRNATPIGMALRLSLPLGHMQKKTADTLTMTSNDRHITTHTDFQIGLIQLDQ